MKRVIIRNGQINANLCEAMTIDDVNNEAREANTSPTEGQISAGNYKMGHVWIRGFKISIENPAGSKRYYDEDNGEKSFVKIKNHYGYFSMTKGKDGDAIDVFIGNDYNFKFVYVVDQNKPDGSFDESKVMLGFSSLEDAMDAYKSNYSKDWKGMRCISKSPIRYFKKWLYDGMKQTKPFSEYKEFKELVQRTRKNKIKKGGL